MIIVGIDEVGRGCWAGPLVAGAVILPPDFALEDGPVKTVKSKIKLRDSKKLSASQREATAEYIENTALAIGLGWVWPDELDISGITTAVKRAMQRALDAIQMPYESVIIDGHINYLPNATNSQAIIKADDSIPAVSAASIMAKVARDKWMHDHAHAEFPDYGFDTHVGYGTAVHVAALAKYGVTPHHRRSYKPIKKLLEVA